MCSGGGGGGRAELFNGGRGGRGGRSRGLTLVGPHARVGLRLAGRRIGLLDDDDVDGDNELDAALKYRKAVVPRETFASGLDQRRLQLKGPMTAIVAVPVSD